MTESKEYIRRIKEREARDSRIKQQKIEEQSIIDSSRNLKEFIQDERYSFFKLCCETKINELLARRNRLKDGTKDDYVWEGVKIDVAVDILNSILTLPDTFFEEEKRILDERGGEQKNHVKNV